LIDRAGRGPEESAMNEEQRIAPPAPAAGEEERLPYSRPRVRTSEAFERAAEPCENAVDEDTFGCIIGTS
jgi:hypothetical protein